MNDRSYLPQIDGLRAVAVLAVILFHINNVWLPGGFVGVDVFFVISGFLITGIILREIDAGTFSFWQFYRRRILRIYPALVLVIAVTLLAGYALMLGPNYAKLGDSARWAAVGLSNLYFAGQSGYFDDASTTLPLLHTWSLGVEEQFYFAWPLLLVVGVPLVRALRLPRVVLATVISACSLVFAYFAMQDSSAMAFYSPLSRAWELGLGAIVASLPPLAGRRIGPLANGAGLLLVVVALIGGRHLPLFAGCLGAALLVWPKASPGWAGAFLALRPLRFVGKISYSLYLWHWPLLVLTREYLLFGERVPIWVLPAYLVGLFLLSIASWRFVERPFRESGKGRRITPLAGAVAGAVVVALAGSYVLLAQGLPARFPAASARYASFVSPQDPRPSEICFIYSAFRGPEDLTLDKCIVHDPNRPNVLLIGDSHSNQFVEAFREVFPEISFSRVGSSGCWPIDPPTGEIRCKRTMRLVFSQYLKQTHFDAVVMSARWRLQPRLEGLPKTVAEVASEAGQVVVLGPTPEYRDPLPLVLAYGLTRGAAFVTANEDNSLIYKAQDRLALIMAGTAAHYVPIMDIVCPNGVCRSTTPGDEPMLHDRNHLSPSGARYVLAELRRRGLFADLLATAPKK